MTDITVVNRVWAARRPWAAPWCMCSSSAMARCRRPSSAACCWPRTHATRPPTARTRWACWCSWRGAPCSSGRSAGTGGPSCSSLPVGVPTGALSPGQAAVFQSPYGGLLLAMHACCGGGQSHQCCRGGGAAGGLRCTAMGIGRKRRSLVFPGCRAIVWCTEGRCLIWHRHGAV